MAARIFVGERDVVELRCNADIVEHCGDVEKFVIRLESAHTGKRLRSQPGALHMIQEGWRVVRGRDFERGPRGLTVGNGELGELHHHIMADSEACGRVLRLGSRQRAVGIPRMRRAIT
jgi:hypothetical protein